MHASGPEKQMGSPELASKSYGRLLGGGIETLCPEDNDDISRKEGKVGSGNLKQGWGEQAQGQDTLERKLYSGGN